MNNCIFTGFDEKYWKNWGSCWVYTIREISKYKGKLVVIDCGLSDETKNKLKEKNVDIIKNKDQGEIKKRVLKEIANYSRSNKGNFVYWDADVFFEGPIDKVFDEIKEKIIICKNKNAGFIGAPYYHWIFVEDIIKLTEFAKKDNQGNQIINCLIENFEKFINYVSNTWNFIDLSQLSEKKLEVDGEKPKVIHPTKSLKSSLSHKGFLFYERKNKEYLEFLESKKTGGRRLINKK